VATIPPITFTVSGTQANDFTVAQVSCPTQIIAGDPITVEVPITNTTAFDTPVTVSMQVKEEDKFLTITWNGDLVNTLSTQLTFSAGQKILVPFTYTETTDVGTRDLIIKVTAANGATVGSGEFDSAYNVIAQVSPGRQQL
jgi:hypothetical protein